MKNNYGRLIAELRLLIGFLGEKSEYNWWASNFISPSSEAFLKPVFSRTTLLAQYHGVSEAALLVHDGHIGVGANYHLYRLPDSIERAAIKSIQDIDFQEQLKSYMSSTETALGRLKELCPNSVDRAEGPIVIGKYSDAKLENLLMDSVAHYIKAFTDNYKCFPYMREA